MRFIGRSLTGLFLLALTLGLLAVAGQLIWSAVKERHAQETPSMPARERVFAVNVVIVEPQTISPVLRSFGQVESRRTLELRATAGGRIVWLAEGFETGARVEAGALLARIDPAQAETALAFARNDLAEAEASLREARTALEIARDELVASGEQALLQERALARQRDLVARGVGTDAAVEAAELAVAAARQAALARRQAVAQAEARLDQAGTVLERRAIAVADAERTLSETEIRAPFAGALAEVSVVDGGLVAVNERLASIVDPEALEVAFRVSNSQFGRLIGADGGLLDLPFRAALEVLGTDLVAEGRLARAGAVVEEGQTGRLVFGRLGAAPGFRPGDFVTIDIVEAPLAEVSRLPASAVGAEGAVLVVGADERLESVPVEVLRRQEDDVLVRAGALAGLVVVAERTPLLGEGIKVRPVAPGAVGRTNEPETVELDPERRARLVAFVESQSTMPTEARERVLTQLRLERVPLRVIERIESRMGG